MKQSLLSLTITLLVLQVCFAQTGPWEHRVYRATSADGLNWTRDTTLLFFPASVPGAVKDTQGIIFIYYVYMAEQTSIETLMVATSTDGKSFTTPQPINVTSSVVIQKVDPNPVLLPDGRIRLYYLDFGTMPTKDIYSATSTDGINFTEEAGIRFSHDNITDPDVFLVENTWVMFVSSGAQMIRATSSDGLNFSEDTSFHWNNGSVSSTFRFPYDIYRTYFCGNGIQSATSTDGYNLTVEDGTRITHANDEIVCDPTVVELSTDSYIMYYKVQLTSTGVEEDINKCCSNSNLYSYPNLFCTTTTVEFTLFQPDFVTLKLYNVLGREIKTLVYGSFNRGKHTVNFDARDLPSGIYFYQLKTKNFMQTKKLEVIK